MIRFFFYPSSLCNLFFLLFYKWINVFYNLGNPTAHQENTLKQFNYSAIKQV